MTARADRRDAEELQRFKAELFKALGHPLRIRMVELMRRHEVSVRDLLRLLEVAPSTASQQLGILRARGVVESHRSGGTVYYRLRDPQIGEVLDVGRRVFARQARALQGLLDADARTRGAAKRTPR